MITAEQALESPEAAELLERDACRCMLAPYAERMLRVTLFAWQSALAEAMERFLRDVEKGRSPRLIVCAPPQHGKSSLVSRAFPAWSLGRHPNWPIIVGSYAAGLASAHGRWVRNALGDPRHTALFPACVLSQDSKAHDEFQTMQGGQMLSRGIGGGTTGHPGRIFIVDDPLADREEADSLLIREKVWAWYHSVATTRLAPGGGILCMATRWHLDDLAGRLLEAAKDPGCDQWTVLRFPAIAEEDDSFRKKGEALGRYPLEELIRKKANLPPRDWAAMYQQNPIPDGGIFFNMQKIHYLDTMPTTERVYIAWDFAVTSDALNRGDQSCGTVLAVDSVGRYLVLDVVAGRWASDELVRHMVALARKWKPMQVLVEKGAIWLAIKPWLTKQMSKDGTWMVVTPVPAAKDKVARASSIRGVIDSGNLYVPRHASWLAAWRDEMQSFPSGKHDDLVDPLAYLGMRLPEMLHNEPSPQHILLSPDQARSADIQRRYSGMRDKALRELRGEPEPEEGEWT